MSHFVTIIIPSYNNKHLLINCVETLKVFTKGYELVIVDNNSNKDTITYLNHLEYTI